MTREEAINHLKDILAEATETEHAVCYVTNEDADALEIAIEALERKTGYWSVKGGKYICPICGTGFGNAQLPYSFKFCPK